LYISGRVLSKNEHTPIVALSSVLKRKRVTALCVMALVCVFSFSCRKKTDREYKSDEKHMGNGHVYSWIITDYTGKPKSLGFTMTASALEGLSNTGNHNDPHNNVDLPLIPRVAKQTPIDHIGIDWNPNGHVPATYSLNFYMMTLSERSQIGTNVTDSLRHTKAPPADYLPAGYINPPPFLAAEPRMGTHWIDPNSPEVCCNAPFTFHFVYGSFNGRVNFIEPMITYDMFKGITDFTKNVPRPAKVHISGYYPTLLHIYQQDGNYTVAMENMEYRTAE
jgi:hypothetical protein